MHADVLCIMEDHLDIVALSIDMAFRCRRHKMAVLNCNVLPPPNNIIPYSNIKWTMGLGIIEPRQSGEIGSLCVPGTSRLLEHDLFHGITNGANKIVLVPRPSDDPLDPLVGQLCALLKDVIMTDLADRDGRHGKRILRFSPCAFRSP